MYILDMDIQDLLKKKLTVKGIRTMTRTGTEYITFTFTDEDGVDYKLSVSPYTATQLNTSIKKA